MLNDIFMMFLKDLPVVVEGSVADNRYEKQKSLLLYGIILS